MSTAARPEPDGPDGDDGQEAATVCSARGCRAPARFDLCWNNPKIHPAERRKHWLACPDHRETLAAFLSARGFLREIEPLVRS